MSPAARPILLRARESRTDYLADVLAGWSRTDVEAFAELLDRFADNVADGPATMTVSESSEKEGSRP